MQHSRRAAGVAQGQPIVFGVGGHAAHGFQRVRQGAGVAVAVGMMRAPVAAEIESGCQVARHGPPPCADVGFGHAKARFQKADHRGVIEHLRIDPAASAPGRNHQHRHARPQPVYAVQVRRGVVLFHARDVLVVFALRVHRGRTGQRAAGIARWRGRGRHVVEEAVVLVEHQQQDGLAPDVRVGGQRVQHARRVVRALRRAGRAGMLGPGLGGADPGHLRQRSVQHILAQQVQAASGQRLVLQRGQRSRHAVIGVAIRLEAGGGVQGIVVGHVLVDAPTDTGRFEPFRVSGPGVGAGGVPARQLVIDVAQRRAVAAPRAVIGACPHKQPVGVGAARERAVIGVANGEGARHGVLERHVGRFVVRHGMVFLGGGPAAHAAGIPGVLRVGPGVRRAGYAHGFEGFLRIQPIGQHRARSALVGLVVVLRPDRAMPIVGAVRHWNRKAVAKPAHAGKRAEVVVERPVFLHEDHDVFNIVDRARALVGRNGQGAPDRGGKHGQGAAGPGKGRAVAQEIASAVYGHWLTLRSEAR